MKKHLLHTKAEFVSKANEPEEGVIEAIVGSSNVLDRMGDVIDQAGWDLKNFMKNPVILWGHNVREERPPIGKALKVWLTGDKKAGTGKQQLMFKVKFDLQDSFAAEIFRKIKDGFLNTVSVGFIPLEREDNTYTKAELLELSVVPVPANPEAVVQLRHMGISTIEMKDVLDPEAIKEDEKVEEVEEKDEVETEKVEGEVVDDKKEEVEAEKTEETESEETETEAEDEKVEETESEESESEEEVVEDDKKEVESETKGGKGSGRKPKPKYPKDLEADKTEKDKLAEDLEAKLDQALDDKLEGRELVGKGVIPFKGYETLPESTEWDGPGEVAKAEIEDLKIMATWFDAEKPEAKSSYKLAHHRQMDKKVVWRGVAAAMASLLGARGGVKVPDNDRKGIYDHLAKHYKQYDKEVPEYRMVEEQVLAKYDEEIQAMLLDREEKHLAHLIKKVMKEVKETKKEVKKESPISRSPNTEEVKIAMEIVSQALSMYLKDSMKGGAL